LPVTLRRLAPYAAAPATVAAVSAVVWFARPYLTLAPIALLYLLAVVCGAVAWGRGPGVVASLFAFAALDYLFVPPFFSLRIAAPSEAVSLLVFLAVAVATSRLAADARARAREADARATELGALLRLSDAAVEARSTDAALQAIAALAADVFGAGRCGVLLPDSLGVLRVRGAAPARADPGLTREEEGTAAYVWRDQTPVPHGAARCVPLRLGAHRVGVLWLGPRPDGRPAAAEGRLADSFAAAAAAAIDRRRLLDAATEAEVLRRTDALKTALLGSVSHDLRTPLAALKTGITALLQPEVAWDRETQQEVLAAANEQVDRLTRLIGNLLDLSRIEAGVLAPERRWYDARELIEDTVRRAAPPQHHVAVDVPHDLPVYVDYVQIQQVLTNLLDNAGKYSPAGSDIHVFGAADGDAFVIRVRDAGPGIPGAEAERIFSKFHRLGARPAAAAGGGPPPGTGLGLAICKGLVEAHGGRIAVENPDRPGAVFVVTLPRAASPTAAAPAV
jgi:two-component system sensor histidine kinase KdpD